MLGAISGCQATSVILLLAGHESRPYLYITYFSHAGRSFPAHHPKKVIFPMKLSQTNHQLFRFSTESASPLWSIFTNICVIQYERAFF